jgi:hypothetical protein
MAYTQDELPSGLDIKTTLVGADVHLIGDSVSNEAQAITETNLEITIANSTNFINAITANSIFQNNVNNFVTGGGGGGGGAGASISQVFNYSDFVNDGSGNGIATFLAKMPITAVPIGVIYDFITAFNAGSTMEVLDSKAHGAVIGASVAGDTTNTLIGATFGTPSNFNFNATPHPIVYMSGVVPSVGQVKVTIVYGAGLGGVSDIGNANQNLIPGNTVGIAPFVGGYAFANRGKATVGTFPDTITNPCFTQNIGNDKIFALYQVNATHTLKGVVGTINRGTMNVVWGTPVTYTTTLNDSTNTPLFSLAVFDNDKVGVTYVESGSSNVVKLDISTVSGTTITKNTNTLITTTNTLKGVAICEMSTTTAIVYTQETSTANPQYFGVSISGTGISTVGTPVTATGFLSTSPVIKKSSTNGFLAISTSPATDFQAGTLTGTAVSNIGTVNNFTSNTNVVVCYLSSNKFAVGRVDSSGTDQSKIAILTIDGTTNAVTVGTLLLIQSGFSGNSIGLLVIDANNVIEFDNVNGNAPWRVFDMSGANPVFLYNVYGSENGAFPVNQNSYVNMGSYFIGIDIKNNSLFIEGMAFGFTGLAGTTSTRGTQVLVLTKGIDINQTNVNIGEYYNPDGAGGIVLDSSGTMVGRTSTSVLI